MSIGSGVSRGDCNRNARLKRLRVLVPVTNAIAGIGLAGKKQMVVVTDHDSRVIARRVFRCRTVPGNGRCTRETEVIRGTGVVLRVGLPSRVGAIRMWLMGRRGGRS